MDLSSLEREAYAVPDREAGCEYCFTKTADGMYRDIGICESCADDLGLLFCERCGNYSDEMRPDEDCMNCSIAKIDFR